MEFRPADEIEGYHVHVYYDGATKQWAGHLRRQVAKLFPAAEIGRWRDQAPQGPHPQSHFQIAFANDLFAEIVPWLTLNRGDLNMLVHPNTGDGYEDHANNRMWVGSSIDLRLDHLKRLAEERRAKAAQEAA